MSSKVADLKLGEISLCGVKVDAPRPQLTNQFLKTFLEIPESQNPLAEKNAGKIDDIRQTGNIHFLGGVFDDPTDPAPPPPISRSVTVAANQSLVMPVIEQQIDNVGWDFSFIPGFEQPVPYQLSTDALHYIADKLVDTVTGLSYQLDGRSVIADKDWGKYRVASQSPYTWNVPPSDDITHYRGAYPDEWIKPPYTKGVQDGYWVQLDNLSLGRHTIHFKATIEYFKIEADVDYDHSGSIGDHPVEFLLQYLSSLDSATQDITYRVNVLPRPQFSAIFS